MKKRFSEEQIIGFLGESDAGLPIKDLCRKHGFSKASYHLWRNKFGAIARDHTDLLQPLHWALAGGGRQLHPSCQPALLMRPSASAPSRRRLARLSVDSATR